MTRLGWVQQLYSSPRFAELIYSTICRVGRWGWGVWGERGGGLCGNWTSAFGFEGCFFTFVPLVRCNFVCSLLNFKFVRLNRFEQFMSNCWFVQAERLYCVCVLVLCITVYPVPGTVSCVPRAARVLSGYQWFTRTGFVWIGCQSSHLGLWCELVLVVGWWIGVHSTSCSAGR